MTPEQLLILMHDHGEPIPRAKLATLSGMFPEDLTVLLDLLVLRGDVRKRAGRSVYYEALTRPADPVKAPYRPHWATSELKADNRSHWNLTDAARKLGIR